MVDAEAERVSDYWRVEVFVSDLGAAAAGELLADAVRDQLADRGIDAYVHVRTWTGSWQ